MKKPLELFNRKTGGLPPELLAAAPSGRVNARFPVTVLYEDGGLFRRSASGWGESFDLDGICVGLQETLPRGRAVWVRFQAPQSVAGLYSGMRCEFPALVTGSRAASGPKPGCELSLKWQAPLWELASRMAAWRWNKIGVLLAIALAATLWMRWLTLADFWYDPVFSAYSAAIALFFYSRFILAYIHRPPPYTGYEPTISIVISVRNEENGIEAGIASCFAADYPSHKREVIVVDDGSTDGTAKVLARLQRERPELKLFSQPPSGKRKGMAKGIREAVGEIVVVIDSDSILERMALRHIVCGFEDPELGAVSGYTAVNNAAKNMLTRMQDVRYLVSFELMKAPESVFGAVTCCPGCLSAYRRKYLLEYLDPWLKQTFWGVPSTFGDDRSLTNFILRKYRAIYNPLARSSTAVPETWGRYMRQQCRWKKSWLREAPIASRVLARKNPIAALSFYVSAICSIVSPCMIFRMFSWEMDGETDMVAGYLAGAALLGLSMGLFALWKRPSKHWYMTWYWLLTQLLIMSPQTYYALLTVRKSHWGTR